MCLFKPRHPIYNGPKKKDEKSHCPLAEGLIKVGTKSCMDWPDSGADNTQVGIELTPVLAKSTNCQVITTAPTLKSRG